ncbi:MAG: hypothetical protein ABH863_06525 [Candidatus Micrarchaeota archaeon]
MPEFRSKIAAKVEGGKLLQMELELSDDAMRAKFIKITGDFFIHPEDSLVVLEKALLMAPAGMAASGIASSISEISKSQGIQMLGITPEALAGAFVECIKRAKDAAPTP